MADPDRRLPENVPGRFYVDQTCIDCELCRELAPGHFARHDPKRVSIVVRQPRTDEEIEACHAALAECPVEAIGDEAGQAP
ncbi:MAG: hypothetical protein KatS3mg108_1185 [Isosphaeraceae bacterium]|jgi:ferredoxin|nr:MAG: hypothetical protein KatS3mg108_1185 [Isosphaeraceae bacterium]